MRQIYCVNCDYSTKDQETMEAAKKKIEEDGGSLELNGHEWKGQCPRGCHWEHLRIAYTGKTRGSMKLK